MLKGEILASTTMQEATYDYYYGDTSRIIAEVHSAINTIFNASKEVLAEANRHDLHIAASVLLKMLSYKPKLLDVIVLTRDYYVWESNLKWLVDDYASEWKKLPPAHQSFLYKNFCFQFGLIIEKWKTVDYAPDFLDLCTSFVEKWLTTTNIFSEEINGIL